LQSQTLRQKSIQRVAVRRARAPTLGNIALKVKGQTDQPSLKVGGTNDKILIND